MMFGVPRLFRWIYFLKNVFSDLVMSHAVVKKTKPSRRRWLPFFAVSLFVFHLLMLFLLLQCVPKGTNYSNEVSYIEVKPLKLGRRIALKLEDPPSQLFPRFITHTRDGREQVPVALAESEDEEWEVLTALRVIENVPDEAVKLTLEQVELPEGSVDLIRDRFIIPRFRFVVVDDRLMQPTTSVPEPGALALVACGMVLLVVRRQRA